MALTPTWRQRKQLIRDGFFKGEVNAWGGNPSNPWKWAPWTDKLRAERKQVVSDWCRKTGRKRSEVTPDQLRRSTIYQRMVRQWYVDHGWIQNGQKDVFAALRAFRDPWAKSPQGRDYIPPWYKRRNESRKRAKAVDEQFSTAVGLASI